MLVEDAYVCFNIDLITFFIKFSTDIMLSLFLNTVTESQIVFLVLVLVQLLILRFVITKMFQAFRNPDIYFFLPALFLSLINKMLQVTFLLFLELD